MKIFNSLGCVSPSTDALSDAQKIELNTYMRQFAQEANRRQLLAAESAKRVLIR